MYKIRSSCMRDPLETIDATFSSKEFMHRHNILPSSRKGSGTLIPAFLILYMDCDHLSRCDSPFKRLSAKVSTKRYTSADLANKMAR